MTSIRIVVVDDHSIVREGLRAVLDGFPAMTVIGEGNSAADARSLSRTLQPDVLVLDISMPGESGLSAITDVLRDSPNTRVLMLSVHDDTEYVIESVRAGAHGYLRKDSSPGDFRAAIQAVARGDAFYSPAVAKQMAIALQERLATPASRSMETTGDGLTAREREVLLQVASGASNKEIAAILGISIRTVEAHRDSIGKKLGVRSVAELTRYCLEHGLLRQSPT